MRYPAEDSFDFTFEGREFRAETFRDDDMGEPWKEHDGHGVVSEWTSRDKAPGERLLVRDSHGHSRRYYDVAGTQVIALRDGWDAEPYGGTKRQQAARAVEADFRRMKAWCDDEWQWVYLKVTLLDADGEETDEYATIGGIESDSGREYFEDEARQLAGEIGARLPSEEYAGDIPVEVAR